MKRYSFCLAVTVLLGLGACGIDAPEGVSVACATAFSEAAAVSDLQDTHEDLFPAYSACTTLEEWRAANKAFPDAMDAIGDPVSYASNVCKSYSNRLGGTPICKAIANQ